MVEAGTANASAVAATSITKGVARDLLTASLPVPDAVLQSCTERMVTIGMRALLQILNLRSTLDPICTEPYIRAQPWTLHAALGRGTGP